MRKQVHTNILRGEIMAKMGWKVPSEKRTLSGCVYLPPVKLPADFSTNGAIVHVEDYLSGRTYRALVLTSKQAQAVSSTNARRPHRVLLSCNFCGKLIPAGRLLQHEYACEHEVDYQLRRYAMGGV